MKSAENARRANSTPRWRDDFPVGWERDHYVTRRELAKFLTLGSALLAVASTVIAAIGRWMPRATRWPRIKIAGASDLQVGGSTLFQYPTTEDPCILVRLKDGSLRGYSQVCTHLSCAVVHQPGTGNLFCPCHHGFFDEGSGRPTAGPPTRPLPRIRIIEEGNDIYAVAKEI
jgi:Rieske Fe-S protein